MSINGEYVEIQWLIVGVIVGIIGAYACFGFGWAVIELTIAIFRGEM